MKTLYQFHKKAWFTLLLGVLVVAVTVISCTKYDDYIPEGMNAPLKLSTEKSSYTLTQKGALSNIAINYNWTTGSNKGTNTSITYELQLDLATNSFRNPLVYNMSKANYSKAFTVAALNDTLLNHWGIEPNTAVNVSSRVIAYINTTPVTTDTSNVLTVTVTPYKPVTKKLYMVGDASPNGWDIANATEMTPNENEPTVFTYKGPMKAGHFKLPVNRNTNWGQDMYMRDTNDPDSTTIYLHRGGDPDDNQWEIFSAGLYKIEVSLCDLTIDISTYKGAEYSEMFMVGDATPNGWDIANATAMIQDKANPNLFKYSGILKVGDFKFPVNRNSDWGQDMFMRDTNDPDSLTVYKHIGGASDDNQWHIYKEGFYVVMLDVKNLTISIEQIDKLFIVGSATSVGWTIADAIELSRGSTNYEFIFTGSLVAGDFKFPVNRNTSWSQHFFMKNETDASKIYFHWGGGGDDNKWSITNAQAGNYTITLNLKELTINMQKQ